MIADSLLCFCLAVLFFCLFFVNLSFFPRLPMFLFMVTGTYVSGICLGVIQTSPCFQDCQSVSPPINYMCKLAVKIWKNARTRSQVQGLCPVANTARNNCIQIYNTNSPTCRLLLTNSMKIDFSFEHLSTINQRGRQTGLRTCKKPCHAFSLPPLSRQVISIISLSS